MHVGDFCQQEIISDLVKPPRRISPGRLNMFSRRKLAELAVAIAKQVLQLFSIMH